MVSVDVKHMFTYCRLCTRAEISPETKFCAHTQNSVHLNVVRVRLQTEVLRHVCIYACKTIMQNVSVLRYAAGIIILQQYSVYCAVFCCIVVVLLTAFIQRYSLLSSRLTA